MPQGAAEAVQSRDDQGVAGGGAGPGAGRGREGSPPAVSVNARWQPARSRASTWGWGCWSLAGGISVAEQVSHAGGVAEPCGWVGCATLIPDTGSGHVQVPWAASVRKGTLSCRPANALPASLCRRSATTCAQLDHFNCFLHRANHDITTIHDQGQSPVDLVKPAPWPRSGRWLRCPCRSDRKRRRGMSGHAYQVRRHPSPWKGIGQQMSVGRPPI
jgi:hypothetical protein